MSTFIVAELSANHNGSLQTALKTIKAIAETGADAVKIQTYTADTITIDVDRPEFYIDSGTIWDGKTLYELYSEAYTPWEWHRELKEFSESLELEFFSSPFDPTAVDFLEELGVSRYKIASFEITDVPLISYVASKGKPVIISTGIATTGDIQLAVDTCKQAGGNDITLLQCTSSYPAPPAFANLRTIPNLRETFGVESGLSDHTVGGALSVAATALGASVIEKHFTLDRSSGGPDAAFSMEPDEFRRMIDDIRMVEEALGSVDYRQSPAKQAGRKFSRSLFVVKDIEMGERLSHENIRSIRPGNGLHPKFLSQVVGRKARSRLTRGTPLDFSHFE